MKSVSAAECAALAAWRVLQAGDRVGGIIFNEREIVKIRPHRSQAKVLRLLHETVRFNRLLKTQESMDGSITLNDALECADRIASHDYLVVVISDLNGINEQTEKLATSIAAHNDVLIVGVYDPLGASLFGQPGMVATDSGHSWELSADSKFSERFQREFENTLDHWTEVFRSIRVPVLPISTATPVPEQIRRLFGQTAPT